MSKKSGKPVEIVRLWPGKLFTKSHVISKPFLVLEIVRYIIPKRK